METISQENVPPQQNTEVQTVEKNQIQVPDILPTESVFSIKLFDHAQRVAKMLCSSSLIPKEFQGNIQNTMIALEMANRIGASPLMIMQNLYIVYGKPGWSSQFVIASINSCGRFKALRFDMTGASGSMERACTAWTVEKGVVIPDGIRTLEQARAAALPVIDGAEVTMKMANDEGWISKNGSKWKTMPEVMLRYRAATFFGRMHCPEIMMGMKTQDEIIDIESTPVNSNGHHPTANVPLPTIEEINALMEEKMEFLTKKEFDDAKRIIENKEENSYRKLHTLLTSKAA